MSQKSNEVSVAILAGGQSRRMGSDKALLPLIQGGAPLISLVINKVASISQDRFIISPSRPGYHDLGISVVPDDWPNAGPLGGLATALRAAKHERCLVVSCDMPFLNRKLLEWMMTQPSDYDVLIPTVPGSSRQGESLIYQTLHAIYSTSCFPIVEQALQRGDRRMTSIFPDLRVQTVPEEIMNRLDPDGYSLFSVNSPDALQAAHDLVARGCVHI